MSHPELDHAAGPAAPVIRVLTRLGFAAKGTVTFLVGVLALRYALRAGGSITDQEGAVEWVVRHPFGRWILGGLAVGLAGYALWMYVAAVLDPERKGANFQAVAERLGFFITGIGYTLLAYTAFTLLLGRRDVAGTDVKHVVAMVLTPHVGRVVVGLAGVTVMIAGVFQLRLGVTGRFRNQLGSGLSRLELAAVDASGRFGYLTLGILSEMIGWSLVQVAGPVRPVQARRLAGRPVAALRNGQWAGAAGRRRCRAHLLRPLLRASGQVSKAVGRGSSPVDHWLGPSAPGGPVSSRRLRAVELRAFPPRNRK